MDITDLKRRAREYLSPAKLAVVEEAYQFALEAHRGQLRKSGEPYVEHPIQTAMIVADLQLDANSIAAALLHDVVEDCGVPPKDIEARFGEEVAKLVEGTTKLARLTREAPDAASVEDSQAHLESLRKMLVAMAQDVRVVLIKLADRLHNMGTLAHLPPEKARAIAQETMQIYAPLAHRLGIWQLKWQLEDLAFRYLDPERYRRVARLISARRADREKYIAQVSRVLKDELEKTGITAQISGRPKSIYSVHLKMEKYLAQGKDFNDIYDLLALRVLVDQVQDCYSALGIIHTLWHPLPGEFNDYIANPKGNGYQALHTTVMCLDAIPLEIQTKTHEMHRIAEYGIAAHWRYKEGTKGDMHFEEKVAWLRQLIEWHRELSGAEEFLESVKTDILIDQVFVFTPKGEIKSLPVGSTPLDFAYHIHTDLGHRCIGAKVNGKLVSLNYQLGNGDTVEILTAKRERGPSLDWLNPDLGYISTSRAREKIRQWFKKQARTENIERGRQLLEKELRRLGLSLGSQEELAHLFKYESLDDFLAAIGDGGINPSQIAQKLAAQQEPARTPEPAPAKAASPSGIRVLGVGHLLTNLARCCHPVPGDEIVGYVTRSRGVTIHRRACHNIDHVAEKERLIWTDWGDTDQLFPVLIRIEAWDRVGLLRDVSTLVAEERVNIAAVNASEHDDHTTSIMLTLETKDITQLSRLLSKIEGIRGVLSVARSTEGAS